MNREIKFRAKDSDGKFVYSGGFEDQFWYAINDGQFDRGSLGQYIGLKDKNGKEIYEGDIVRIEDRYNQIIEDLEDAFYFQAERFDFATTEVVGNIYDNPELLEGQK